MALSLLAAYGLAASPARAEAQRSPSPGRLRIDFIAVGQGDAALIASPTGKTVLVDGGPRESADLLLAFLRPRLASPLDLILLTHRHADHLGGLPTVVRVLGAKMFMDAPFPHPSDAYGALLDALATRHVAVRAAERGRTIDLGGGAVMTLLTPPDPPISGSRSDVNANSVVLRLDYRRVGVVFAADAERETEEWLLAANAPLRAQVLKVAHHGSRFSSNRRFIAAVDPRVAVISVGAGNEYGHPAPEAMTRLTREKAEVFRTDLDGTVTLETDGETIAVTTAAGRQAILSP